MGHKYLTEQVQATIRTEAARALAFIDSIEPPISLKDLYLNDNLVTSTFKPDDPDYLELAERIGADAKSLRGCLFVPDRHVIARDDGYKQRTNFVLAHEFGHWKLPWHQALLYQCTQFDLSTKASAQLEKEANFFASELCFMGDNFTKRIHDSEISIKSLAELADKFQMSKEATFRRSIELEQRPCMMLRMTYVPPVVKDGQRGDYMKIDYIVYSDSFQKSFGSIQYDQTFSSDHVLAQVRKSSSNFFESEISLRANNKVLRLQAWKNNWNYFAICTPK